MQSKEDKEKKEDTKDWIEEKMEDFENIKSLENSFTVNENKDLQFTVKPEVNAWKILYYQDDNFEDFFTVPERAYRQNDLYNNRKSITQSLKNKLYHYCEIKSNIRDENLKEDYYNDFLNNLITTINRTPCLKEEEKETKREKQLEDLFQKYSNDIIEFLNKEDKFDFIEETLDFKITRENKNKTLTFTLLSGSYFDLPQIVFFIGESSGGKSYIDKNTLKLFPEKHYFSITGSSDKALIYRSWTELILSISEAQRSEEVLEHLKDMGDEGIGYITVLKDKNGNPKTTEINIGRVSIVATTTNERVNPELMNRAWQLEPDLSVEQTKRIVERSLEKASNLHRVKKKEIEYDHNRKIIKLALQKIRREYRFDAVEIPYAKILKEAIQFSFLRVRRDKNKLLDLIKIITNWNYKIRESYKSLNEKWLLSHPNDLKIALEIGGNIFRNISQNLSPQKIKILDLFNALKNNKNRTKQEESIIGHLNQKDRNKTWYKTNEIYRFYCKTQNYKKSKRSLRNLLNVLVEDGYLSRKKDGRSNKYKLEQEAMIKNIDYDKFFSKAFIQYKKRLTEIKNNEEEKLNSKEIELTGNLKYSKELKRRIDNLFEVNLTDTLPLENIAPTFLNSEGGKKFSKEEISENLFIMCELGFYQKISGKTLKKLGKTDLNQKEKLHEDIYQEVISLIEQDEGKEIPLSVLEKHLKNQGYTQKIIEKNLNLWIKKGLLKEIKGNNDSFIQLKNKNEEIINEQK